MNNATQEAYVLRLPNSYQFERAVDATIILPSTYEEFVGDAKIALTDLFKAENVTLQIGEDRIDNVLGPSEVSLHFQAPRATVEKLSPKIKTLMEQHIA